MLRSLLWWRCREHPWWHSRTPLCDRACRTRADQLIHRSLQMWHRQRRDGRERSTRSASVGPSRPTPSTRWAGACADHRSGHFEPRLTCPAAQAGHTLRDAAKRCRWLPRPASAGRTRTPTRQPSQPWSANLADRTRSCPQRPRRRTSSRPIRLTRDRDRADETVRVAALPHPTETDQSLASGFARVERAATNNTASRTRRGPPLSPGCLTRVDV